MAKALLVIGVQRQHFEGENAPVDMDDVICRINLLTRTARESNTPVIFIQHEQQNSSITGGMPGRPQPENIFQGDNDLVVSKNTMDSFLGTGLKRLLDELDVDSLAICGFASEFCIDSTVRRALALGYPVELIADGHSTTDKPHMSGSAIARHHNATLSAITGFDVNTTLIKAVDWLGSTADII